MQCHPTLNSDKVLIEFLNGCVLYCVAMDSLFDTLYHYKRKSRLTPTLSVLFSLALIFSQIDSAVHIVEHTLDFHHEINDTCDLFQNLNSLDTSVAPIIDIFPALADWYQFGDESIAPLFSGLLSIRGPPIS